MSMELSSYSTASTEGELKLGETLSLAPCLRLAPGATGKGWEPSAESWCEGGKRATFRGCLGLQMPGRSSSKSQATTTSLCFCVPRGHPQATSPPCSRRQTDRQHRRGTRQDTRTDQRGAPAARGDSRDTTRRGPSNRLTGLSSCRELPSTDPFFWRGFVLWGAWKLKREG